MKTTTDSSIQMVTPLVVFVAAVLGAGALGGLTNAINGIISPLYFETIMRWRDVDNIAQAAVAQGVFEGLICGLIFGTIFVIATSMISKLRTGLSKSLSYLGFLFGSALAAWVLGGLLALFLAWLSPEFYRQSFIGVPDAFPAMLGYAWVGGSIWGIQFGGFALLLIWTVIFWWDWKTNSNADH